MRLSTTSPDSVSSQEVVEGGDNVVVTDLIDKSRFGSAKLAVVAAPYLRTRSSLHLHTGRPMVPGAKETCTC